MSDDDSKKSDLDELMIAVELEEKELLIMQIKLIKSMDLVVDWEKIGASIVTNHVEALMQEYGISERDAFLRGVYNKIRN